MPNACWRFGSRKKKLALVSYHGTVASRLDTGAVERELDVAVRLRGPPESILHAEASIGGSIDK
eukprot:966362-Amphidinium_carterae.2